MFSNFILIYFSVIINSVFLGLHLEMINKQNLF